MDPNDYVHYCVTGCHGNSLFFRGGGVKVFDSRISYIMFVDDNLSVCEISPVRTLLKCIQTGRVEVKIGRLRFYDENESDSEISLSFS